MFRNLIFVLALLVFPAPVLAQEAVKTFAKTPVPADVSAPVEKNYPYMDILHPALKKFVEEGGTVSYMGNEHGLNAWVLEKGENVQFSYTTPDGGGIIRGMLFGNAENDFVTQKQVLRFRDLGEDRLLEAFPPIMPGQYASSPAAASEKSAGMARAEQFFAAVEKSAWFSIGKKEARPLYIFVDPTCSHCLTYWKELKSPYVDNGVLQLRLIPVGWKKDAQKSAAALLAAPDPVALWAELAAGNQNALSGVKVTDEALARAKSNADLLAGWKFTTTPLTVYRNTANKVILIVNKPENLMLVVSDLTL